jgi:hypothetical protein
MHPLVRDLYKRVLIVGRDYPTGLDHVKTTWKRALRNPQNCPSCYAITANQQDNQSSDDNQAVRPLPSSLFHDDDATTSSNMNVSLLQQQKQRCNEEIIYAVQNGRNMVKEMMGILQLKKYRAMTQRYGGSGVGSSSSSLMNSAMSSKTPASASDDVEQELQNAVKRLEQQKDVYR